MGGGRQGHHTETWPNTKAAALDAVDLSGLLVIASAHESTSRTHSEVATFQGAHRTARLRMLKASELATRCAQLPGSQRTCQQRSCSFTASGIHGGIPGVVRPPDLLQCRCSRCTAAVYMPIAFRPPFKPRQSRPRQEGLPMLPASVLRTIFGQCTPSQATGSEN